LKVLGVDLSLNGSGFVVIDSESLLVLESRYVLINAKKKSLNSPALYGMERVHYILVQFAEMVKTHRPEKIIIEGYSMGSRGMVYDIGEVGGVIRHFLFDQGIKYFEVPPKTLKKYITGNGNADKDMMMAAVAKKYSQSFQDDNTNDAYALAVMYVELGELNFLEEIGKLRKSKKNMNSKI